MVRLNISALGVCMRFGKATRYATPTITFSSKNNTLLAQVLALSCQKGFEIMHITTIGQCTGFSTRSIDQRVAKVRESLIFKYGAVLYGSINQFTPV